MFPHVSFTLILGKVLYVAGPVGSMAAGYVTVNFLKAQAKLETFPIPEFEKSKFPTSTNPCCSSGDSALETTLSTRGMPLVRGGPPFQWCLCQTVTLGATFQWNLMLARLYIEPPYTFQRLGDRGGPSLSRFLHTVSSAALLRWRLSDGLVAQPLC